jgi:hypothetical protein
MRGTRHIRLIRMDPTRLPVHIHPEEQLMTALRGSMTEGVLDGNYPMN